MLPVMVLAGVLCGWVSSPAPAAFEDLSDRNRVNFNFDQADIRLIVKVVGEMTGRRFVIDDKVTGRITVVTPQQIPVEDVYPLLISLLESSGYTVLEKPEGSYIVPLPDRQLAGGDVLLEGEPVTGSGLMTKVIKVEHISAVELAKLLEPLVRGGKDGAVRAFGNTNHLILTDTADSIRRMERIIGDLDKPGASRSVEVIRLQHAAADDVASQLMSAMQGMVTSGERVSRHIQKVSAGMGDLPADMVVVPVPQANSVVLVGTQVQLAEVKRIISEIDIEAPAEFGRLNAIFLKYILAGEAAETLNKLLEKTETKEGSAPRIAIEPNKANNALIVDAAPQDYDRVLALVQELDRIPQQVMVEVLIAEVTVGDSFEFGVELASVEQPQDGSSTFFGRGRPGPEDTLAGILQDNTFPQGFAIGLARGTIADAAGNIIPQVPILLRALSQDRDVKILSNIPLWAQNNTEASVSVVENIPILSSRIEGTGDNRDVIQNIERVDVGIKLTLTPHVNPDGEVKLQLNPSIEAIVDEGPSETQFAPSIAKREVNTTVTIPDQSTVVISGLIREDKITQVSKFPLLGDIPLIGWLFRSKTDSKLRTNLLIFVTPHIVTGLDKADELKTRLQNKTGIDTSAVSLDDPTGSEGELPGDDPAVDRDEP